MRKKLGIVIIGLASTVLFGKQIKEYFAEKNTLFKKQFTTLNGNRGKKNINSIKSNQKNVFAVNNYNTGKISSSETPPAKNIEEKKTTNTFNLEKISHKILQNPFNKTHKQLHLLSNSTSQTEVTSEVIKDIDKTYYFITSGKGASEPKVPNRTDLALGTARNRRADIKAVAISVTQNGKSINLGEILKEGLYSVVLKFSYLYPSELKNMKIYLKLPENAKTIYDSILVNGKKASARQDGRFIVISKEALHGNKPLEIKMKFFVKKPVKIESIPYVVLFETDKNKLLKIYSSKEVLKEVLAISNYQNSQKTPTPSIVKRKLGIIYPDTDIVQPEDSTDLIIRIPLNSAYSLKVNGKGIPAKYLAEKATDKVSNLLTLKYVGIPLQKGKNIITLKYEGQEEKREILVSDDVADLKFKVFPQEPPADGRSSAYVEILTVDKQGNPVKINTYLKVFVDKGDIYDYRTGTFKKFINDGFRVKVIGGRAVIRLSPAKKPEERKIKAIYGNIEKEFTIQYYQEKRPWIVVGELEGAVGLSDTHNNPIDNDMPYDHSKEGINFKGRGAVFAKGTVKDYTITLRYDTRKPQNTLLQQNIPSTEENQFYPIYGDSSEQYFEAPSKRHLYLRIDKGLSYFLFGDYNTNFGESLDFNRYSRTLNGIMTNLEQKNNYKIKLFASRNNQEIVKQEFRGEGISGPFFLNSSPVEFSEKVWIEVRDRYDEHIVLERRQLNRFTDYDINYEEGFIILHEPFPEFDENLNPEFLVVRYETDSLSEERYIYGVRGEKWIKGIRFGAFGVREEHLINNKDLYGADIYYSKNGIKFISEVAGSKGFEDESLNATSGNAFRAELSYNNQNTHGKLFYKKVTDGFQNPSSTTAEEAYTTYGFNLSKDFKAFGITTNGLIDRRESIKRKEVDLALNKKLSDKLSIDLGGRWNEEEKDTGKESYYQAITGINFKPTEKLDISVRREQSIGGEKESIYYPTRTILKTNYRWSEKTTTYLQTEIREEPDATESVTTLGINSRLGKNTTAFSKYSLYDGSSGWRTQSHIGLNHVFELRDNFAIDAGVENVHNFKTTNDTEDYTAVRLRGVYTQSEKYKLSGEYQIRFGKVKTQHLFRLGGAFKLNEDCTLLARERFFLSEYRENDLLIGMARRPVGWDKLNYLLKLRWKISNRDETTNKYIFSYHINYQPVQKLTLMGEYAAKYTDVKDVGHSFTDLVRGRVLYDITENLDFGFQAGVMMDHTYHTYTLAWGPEIGYNLFKNFWISVGYNFNGFYDNDFDEANYWDKGFYLKFRLKFDEDTLKKAARILGREK